MYLTHKIDYPFEGLPYQALSSLDELADTMTDILSGHLADRRPVILAGDPAKLVLDQIILRQYFPDPEGNIYLSDAHHVVAAENIRHDIIAEVHDCAKVGTAEALYASSAMDAARADYCSDYIRLLEYPPEVNGCYYRSTYLHYGKLPAVIYVGNIHSLYPEDKRNLHGLNTSNGLLHCLMHKDDLRS